MKKIAVIVPVYCEANNLQPLIDRLENVFLGLESYNYEYILVNDGSTDHSFEVLQNLAKDLHKLKVIDLSRNFGKEIALTAGIHEALDADAAICIDADLQHPPELIPALINEWEKGAEIVATIRTQIDRQPLLRRIGSHIFYWLMSKISGLGMVSQTTDYRLYDKKVIAAFCKVTERERIFRGIMDWLGFRKVYVEFAADSRKEGQAGYSYAKLYQLAINSITSFSLWPLRLTGYFGLAITSISGVLLVWMLINYHFGNKVSFTPLAIVIVANTFLMGVVLTSIGLVALYIGAIHTEVINRPLYLVRKRLNFDAPLGKSIHHTAHL